MHFKTCLSYDPETGVKHKILATDPWVHSLSWYFVVISPGPANRQPLTLSRQDGCVCSATLLVLVHLKTTHVLYEQPSAGCLWTGNGHLVDQDEPGFKRLSSTFSSIISESTPPGSICAGPFQVVQTHGDGNVLSRMRHSMMMMMMMMMMMIIHPPSPPRCFL